MQTFRNVHVNALEFFYLGVKTSVYHGLTRRGRESILGAMFLTDECRLAVKRVMVLREMQRMVITRNMKSAEKMITRW